MINQSTWKNMFRLAMNHPSATTEHFNRALVDRETSRALSDEQIGHLIPSESIHHLIKKRGGTPLVLEHPISSLKNFSDEHVKTYLDRGEYSIAHMIIPYASFELKKHLSENHPSEEVRNIAKGFL